MGGGDQGRRELVAGRGPGDLLLGLGGQPTGLRSELGQDVVDPCEVDLGLGELVLRLAPAPLVASDAGDLLEQRPPLLGSQRERLVDHALADEQERVVGEVRRIEQVDEVAQPDPLAVEQVLVLARAVQPAADLDLAVVDRQEPVGVVDDQRHVGHAEARRADRSRRRSRPRTCGVRSARPCSPSAQRSASARLLLPQPFGPTTALMPGPNSTTVFSANDLKPTAAVRRRRAGAVSRASSRADRARAASAPPPSRPTSAIGPRPARGPCHRPRPRPGTSRCGGPASLDQPVVRARARSSAGCAPGARSWRSSAHRQRASLGQLGLGQLEQPVARCRASPSSR